MKFFFRKSTFSSYILFLALFLLPFLPSVAFADPPSSPYAPGETLDPSCSPGDSNCTVNTAIAPYFEATSTTATSSFAGPVIFNGQCVTEDTKIRRRKKNKQGSFDGWEDVPLTDLNIGDEVSTLDQKGNIITSKILRNIVSTGIQDVYELRTISGYNVKTTGEHPFLKTDKATNSVDKGVWTQSKYLTLN